MGAAPRVCVGSWWRRRIPLTPSPSQRNESIDSKLGKRKIRRTLGNKSNIHKNAGRQMMAIHFARFRNLYVEVRILDKQVSDLGGFPAN